MIIDKQNPFKLPIVTAIRCRSEPLVRFSRAVDSIMIQLKYSVAAFTLKILPGIINYSNCLLVLFDVIIMRIQIIL